MTLNSIDAIAPAYDFRPMSPTLKRLVELAVQARRDAVFFGLDAVTARSEKPLQPEAGPATDARPLTDVAPASVETGRLDLRA